MQVVKASKLINDINIGFKKNNSAKVFIDLNDFKVFFNENKLPSNSAIQPALFESIFLFIKIIILNVNFVFQTKENNKNGIGKLCTFCINSKSTQVVRQNMCMIPITNKLNKIHVDL